MMWAVFSILHSSNNVKEYINSISTDIKQPDRYYVKKKLSMNQTLPYVLKNGEIYLYLLIYVYNTSGKMLKKLTTLVVCEERVIAERETFTERSVVHFGFQTMHIYYL